MHRTIVGSSNHSFAFVEHVLKRAQPDGEQSQADPVEAEFLRRRGVAQERQEQQDGDDSRQDVDVEDPVPRKIVGQNSADRRTGRRPDDRAQRVDRLADAELRGRKGVAQDDLRRRQQAAAEKALHDAKDDQLLDRGRQTAGQRRERKPCDRDEIILLASEAQLQPRRHRNDDDRRDDVSRDDPGAFVDRSAEIALNRRQRDVDDRAVERLQQRSEHDPRHDQHPANAVLDDVCRGARCGGFAVLRAWHRLHVYDCVTASAQQWFQSRHAPAHMLTLGGSRFERWAGLHRHRDAGFLERVRLRALSVNA